MLERDLFACLDEFVANAPKKTPPPGGIRLRVGSPDTKRAVVTAEDDGAPPHEVRSRGERAGSRSGLDRLRAFLQPYGGNRRREPTEEGGARVVRSVPRFDTEGTQRGKEAT